MRSREVTVTLRVKYTIEDDADQLEAYEVDSLDELTVDKVKAFDGDENKVSIYEIVEMADHVEITTWSLGPCLNL